MTLLRLNAGPAVARPRPAVPRARRGMALAVAIFAIVVIGALLAGAYFASSQERKIGRNTLVEQRSLNVAEYGLNFDVSNWDQSRNLEGTFPVGTVDANPRYVNQIGDTAFVSVTRLTPTNFLVVSSGRANIDNASTQAFRRTSMMVQIAYPSVNLAGALVSAGQVRLGGSGAIVGFDKDPAGWGGECDPYATANLAAIAVGSADMLKMKNTDSVYAEPTASNPNGAFAPEGSGIMQITPVASTPSTYISYGSESWETLKANADIKLPATFTSSPAPSLVAGTTKCDRTNVANWGQINHVNTTAAPNAFADCIKYYPIIYAPGDLSISGGTGQGILMVNGNLTVNGGFEFDGLVIVKNELKKGNGTATIRGGVMVAGANINCTVLGSNGQCMEVVDMTGTITIAYSKCAVENALRGSAILVPVKQRSWAQLY